MRYVAYKNIILRAILSDEWYSQHFYDHKIGTSIFFSRIKQTHYNTQNNV